MEQVGMGGERGAKKVMMLMTMTSDAPTAKSKPKGAMTTHYITQTTHTSLHKHPDTQLKQCRLGMQLPHVLVSF